MRTEKLTVEIPEGSSAEFKELIHNYTENYLRGQLLKVPDEKQAEFEQAVDDVRVANGLETKFTKEVVNEP